MSDLITPTDALTSFLKFADDMREIYERYNRPAWAETCACGGSIEVSKEVPNPERARMWRQWQGRHGRCTEAGRAALEHVAAGEQP